MKLQGKNVLITGASSGIGEAFAYRAARDGANVILAARRKDKLNKVKEKVEELGGKGTVVETDVTKPDDIKKLFQKATKNGEILDVVFDNAGLGFIAPIQDLKVEQIKTMVDVNITGMITVAKFASEVFTKQEYGHLIMTASLASFVTLPEWSVYVATKWGINGFAGSIRHDLRPYNVKVTTVHPGAVRTEFFDKNKANLDIKDIGSSISPDQVAEEVYKAVFTNKKQVLVPGSTKVYAFLSRYAPWIVDFMLKRMADKVKKNTN